ncbi:hypothetical protein [Georgenia muralis]|nr:hypothetical protein [Georgenia muralis]
MLTNGSFEQWDTGWAVAGPAQVRESAADATDGVRAVNTWSDPTIEVVVGEDGVVTVAVTASLTAQAWGWYDGVVLTPATGAVVDTTALLAQLDLAVEYAHVVLAASRARGDVEVPCRPEHPRTVDTLG